MGGVRIVDMPDLGAPTDVASLVGELAGSGRFLLPALRTYFGATVAAGLTAEITARKRNTVSVLDFAGVVGNGVNDDTVGFQNALNSRYSAVAIKGGAVDVPAGYNFRVGNISVPPGVTLQGPYPSGPGAPGLANFSPPYGTLSSLRLMAGTTITLDGGGAISGLFIAPDGMTFQQTTSAGFAGTAITVAGDDVVVEKCMIMGFVQGITSTNFSRLRLRDLNLDCLGGVYVNNSTDVCHFDRIQLWPYATISQAGTDTLRRSGYGIRMVSCNDDSRLTDCFTYGYAEGFSIESCIGTVMTSCAADSTNVGIGIGFNIVGGATEIQLIDCDSSAQQIGYNITPTIAADTLVTVTNCAAWSSSAHGILIDTPAIGDVTIRGGSVSGSVNGITIGSAVSRVDIDGVRFEGITAASAITVNVASSRVRIGPMCNFGTNGAGTNGVAAGANLTIPVVASASAITLPPNAAMVSISGTTGIGTINGGWAGRIVNLIFAGTTCPVFSTFTGAAGAIRLAGNLSIVASTGSTLVLIHNGTQWHQIGGSPDANIDVLGTLTNDTAAAGQVGELITSTLPQASASALSNNTGQNITSINLTAGDWDVNGSVGLVVSSSLTSAQAWVSAVSNTPPGLTGGFAILTATIGSGTLLPTGTARISLASAATVYLGVQTSFASGTCSGYGFIRARRVR